MVEQEKSIVAEVLKSAMIMKGMFEGIKHAHIQCPRCDEECFLSELNKELIVFKCGVCNFEIRLDHVSD